MKLSLIILIATSLHATASSFAQVVTIKKNRAPLTEVLKEIRKQSGYNIFYNSELTKNSKPVTCTISTDNIKEVMDRALAGQSLKYEIVDRNIVISRIPTVSKTERPRVTTPLIQENKEVRGIIRDTTGSVLPGVSIKLKGSTSIGTSSDLNGRYIVSIPANGTLVYSIVGYESQEINTTGREVVDVILKEVQSMLDDIVISAFGGATKRTDMIGSITMVKPDDLKIPSSNLTTALAGKVAGIIAYQRSGEPGQDNADFFIRGVTTFGVQKSPLILIDGMELTTTDLARLQPEDIASFSIMKDATSTAVYGARGANGVILVTTKKGVVGKAKLSFKVDNSVSAATKNVEFADPITYMRMHNEAVLTRTDLGSLSKQTVLYSDEKIANTLAGKNPEAYPANNWKDMLFKDYTMNQRYNLNVSGGGGVARYFVSGSLNQDNGLLKVDRRNNFNNNIDLKSYTLRSNVTIDLTKTTEAVVRLSGNFDDYNGPISGGQEMYYRVMRSNPVLFPAYYTPNDRYSFVQHIMFGNAGTGNYINPYADLVRGYKDSSRALMLAQIEVNQNLAAITEGLTFKTMMNTNRESYFDVNRFYNPFLYSMTGYDKFNDKLYLSNLNEDKGTEYLDYLEGQKIVKSTFYLESMLNYDRLFADKHNFSGLLVGILRNSLNANAGDLQLSLPFRNLGLSGRGTYSYDRKYYAEFNFGYNGSERFHESKRFGFFPSVGLAWSASNEKFFEPWKDVITNLRFRATYGLIGNDAIGRPQDRFFYLSNTNMSDPSRGATFGRDLNRTLPGISLSRYANSGITWEISKKKNIALELGLFDQLNIQAEYFNEYRSNILMERASVPVTMGLAVPIRANVGEASGKGIDISIDYNKSFSNGLVLSAMGNFTYSSSKYEVYEEPQYSEAYRHRKGSSIYQNYGLIAEKLFVDDEEAANSPRQEFGQYGGGDIKYLDVNRDGRITSADMVPIGNPTLPEIVYGLMVSTSYKGIDLSVFFQGLANESFWIATSGTNSTSPFNNETQVIKAYADSHWSEDHQDEYALWPRLSTTINQNNAQSSTWFMRNGTFLRLKNAEVGYTFPKSIQRRLAASDLRLYFSGTNLLTFSPYKMWDPEMGGAGLGYPVQRVFNIGLRIQFN